MSDHRSSRTRWPSLRRTAEAIPNADGRPLYAGHAELAWPQSPHAQLWHAITLLREYRGDGHIAALVTHGLSGIEALITHIATGTGFDPEVRQAVAGLDQEQWDDAVGALTTRGLLDDAGQLTAAGGDLRTKIEDLTDELAFAPWRTRARRRRAEAGRSRGGHPGLRARGRGISRQRLRPAVRPAPLVRVLVELADRGHAVDASPARSARGGFRCRPT